MIFAFMKKKSQLSQITKSLILKKVIALGLFCFISSVLFAEISQNDRKFMEKIDQAVYSGKIDSARILLIEFSKLHPIAKDKKYGALIYSFKSDIERASGNMDMALTFMLKSLDYKEALGESSWYIYHKVANIYFEKKNYHKAKIYADSSMKFGSNPNLIVAKKNMNNRIIAYYYLNKKDYKKAEFYYTEILTINPDFDCEKALIYINLYTINKHNKNLIKAKSCLDSAEYFAKDKYCNAYQYLTMAYEKRIDLAKTNVDYKTAYRYLLLKTQLKDSLDIEERIKQNKELEKKYESKIIKSENKSLSLKNTEIKKKNKLFIVLIGVSLLVVLVVVVFLILLRKRNSLIKISKFKVEKLNDLHQKIFNVISHDFNGSFITLQFLLDEIQYGENDVASLQNKVSEIQNYLNQSNYVLQNLTNWAQIEFKENLIAEKEYAIFPLVEKVVSQLNFQLKAKNISLINDIDLELKTAIPQDYLIIIYRNLINNAIKFSKTGNKIRLFSNENKLLIQDFGVGIADEQLSKLFSQKVESTVGTNNETGFGIGLKIVSELITKFDGKIKVESVLTKGTTFTIVLPAEHEPN
jgi:signal transduction histidine kinase